MLGSRKMRSLDIKDTYPNSIQGARHHQHGNAVPGRVEDFSAQFQAQADRKNHVPVHLDGTVHKQSTEESRKYKNGISRANTTFGSENEQQERKTKHIDYLWTNDRGKTYRSWRVWIKCEKEPLWVHGIHINTSYLFKMSS